MAVIASIAKEQNITSAQLALAWVLSQGDDIATIPGTRQEKYLVQNWASMSVNLSVSQRLKLANTLDAHEVTGERY
jgi:aryl-alcohol dehydrogenase-like predicted oxidoreductase